MIKSIPQMTSGYKTAACLFFLSAVILRLLLYWANPSSNAFDNHFQPIFMIMTSGHIPPAGACWQCYHPPVFYLISAWAGNIALAAGLKYEFLPKLLQFLPCLYGILTVALIYPILRKLPFSDFSRLMAFGLVCFLPRHIYMSAMNSNDSISYLAVALCVYSLLAAIEKDLSASSLLPACLIMTITVFTKYTSYVVLPMAAVAIIMYFRRRPLQTKPALGAFLALILVPSLALSVYWMSNLGRYGSAMPVDIKERRLPVTQPRDPERMDILTFDPWESVTTPIIVPGKMHSFWTLIYSGLWSDNEPKFISLDKDTSGWDQYYAWLKGIDSFHAPGPSISAQNRFYAGGLKALGMFPLLLGFAGFYRFLRGKNGMNGKATDPETAKTSIFPALLLGNTLLLILLAIKSNIYGAVKASYFLNSLPAFAFFIGLGLMHYEKSRKFRLIAACLFGCLFILSAFHIAHISFRLP